MAPVMRGTTTLIPVVLWVVACGPIRSTTTPLAVADQAPGFSLPNQAGQQVTLDELTSSGPAVLVFNRGHR